MLSAEEKWEVKLLGKFISWYVLKNEFKSEHNFVPDKENKKRQKIMK